jgi:hypothetical protein
MLEYNYLTPELLKKNIPELASVIDKDFSDLHSCPELPYVFYPDTIGNELQNMLINDGDMELTKKIFSFYEYLANEGNTDVKDFLQVALLEMLWVCKKTYNISKQFMLPKTRELFDEIGTYFNVP